MSEGWAYHQGGELDELRKADFGNNKASDHSMSHIQNKVGDLKKKKKVCSLLLAKRKIFGRILNEWLIPVEIITLLIFNGNTNLNRLRMGSVRGG